MGQSRRSPLSRPSDRALHGPDLRERAARTCTTPRAQLIRAAFHLEWLTIAWMVVEAAIALAAGLMAGSVSLIAFGVDSLIELASAGVLIWRMVVELRHGEASPGRPSAGRAVSAERCCLRSRPMSCWRPDGACGHAKGRNSRGRGCSSASRPSRSCGFCRGRNCGSPMPSGVGRCAPMPLKASLAGGYPLSC